MTRAASQLSKFDWLVKRPIAHRGLHDVAHGRLENTASAFAAAIEHAYAIECDLQLARDNEAMVFHDETLDRVMQTSGWLRDHTSRQLQAFSYKTGTDRMQTLGELLDQVQERVTLVIELKSHFDGDLRLAKRAVDVLKTYQGPYCLMSFDPLLVEAVAEISPHTVRGITADSTVESDYPTLPKVDLLNMRHLQHLNKTRPHFVSYHFRDLPFAPVQSLREAGHPVITWTVRNAEEERLARLHSDQITFEGYAA